MAQTVIYRSIWQQVLKKEQVSNPLCLGAISGTEFSKELLLVHKSIVQLRTLSK